MLKTMAAMGFVLTVRGITDCREAVKEYLEKTYMISTLKYKRRETRRNEC